MGRAISTAPARQPEIADTAAVGYLDENPEFHHQLLLVRGDALWLVPDGRGAWALPGFVSDEQHTAEVELIARHMRERFGVRVAILGRAEASAAATRSTFAGSTSIGRKGRNARTRRSRRTSKQSVRPGYAVANRCARVAGWSP